MAPEQDKKREIEFFDGHAESGEYNVFTESANKRIINAFVRCTGLPSASRIIDIGCGSGIFTSLLAERGYSAEGLDLSPRLIALARQTFPKLHFIEGDVEALPFPDQTFDGVMLSAILHHLPDPGLCAREVRRVLKPGGRFIAFDPNRLNPFMYLYRDRSSPFYSSVGVTENERPVLAGQIARVFREAGFAVRTSYLGHLPYRYVASTGARLILPLYNALDAALSWPAPLAPLRPFVLTQGERD